MSDRLVRESQARVMESRRLIEASKQTLEALGLRIVRIDQFSEGVGFTADAFDQGIVFLGVVPRRLEFIPEALDERQTLSGLL